MFLQADELKSVIYNYQIEQITEADDDIVLMAITAAIDEAKSYLRPNNKKEWQDGRLQYDVDAVFNAVGAYRNALLLEMTKNIAVWYIIRLCNVDMLYEQIKSRYDRAIDWLKKVNKGEITLDLPVLQPPNNGAAFDANGNLTKPLPWRSDSRRKFNFGDLPGFIGYYDEEIQKGTTNYLAQTLESGQAFTVPNDMFINAAKISATMPTVLNLGTTPGGHDLLNNENITQSGNLYAILVDSGVTIYPTFTGQTITLLIKR